ncbi:MAG: transmembrane anchor protein [Rhodospirillales bacterium]
MYNAEKPHPDELPSTAQLIRSTVIAIVAAAIILITIVLPSEYGIDPTGAGKAIGLTEMGEIKQELSKEAEADHRSSLPDRGEPGLISRLLGVFIGTAHAQEKEPWKDEVRFELKPKETHELKVTMKEGEVTEFEMIVEGGRVNFDLHAHAGGKNASYEKARGSTGSKGKIVAAFDGDHGWFWRNRDRKTVTITLRLRGAYSASKEFK